MFINDIKGLAGFAEELATLNALLSDPKNVKKMSKEIDLANAILAKRDEVLAQKAENEKNMKIIAEKQDSIDAMISEATSAKADAEKYKSEMLTSRKNAESNLKEIEDRLKATKSAETKAENIVKKSVVESEKLAAKVAESDAKTALLDESISRYNDAVAKLSQVKVA